MDSLENTCNFSAINKYYSLISIYGRSKGLNFNIGSVLHQTFKTLDAFSHIEHYTTNFRMDDNLGQKLMLSRFNETHKKLVDEKITDDREMKDIRNEIKRFYNESKLSSCKLYTRQTHIIAKVK